MEDQEFGFGDKEYEDGHWCTAHGQNAYCKEEQYLNESGIAKVEFDELELLLGPEDSEIDFEVHLDECEE